MRSYPSRSIKELSKELGITVKEVREVLKAAGVEIKEDDWRPGLAGFARAHPLGIALLVALMAVVYLNSVRNGFHYDDIHSLLQNLGVRVEWDKNPDSRWLYLRYFDEPELFSSRPGVAMPRPLLMCTFAFNYMISKYEPMSWILVNILLHMANTLIIYVGLSHLSGRPRFSLLTAVFFAIHPINTETVNYINCRSESFGVLFMLLTMYFFARSLREHERWGLRIGAFAFFILGLLSKEMVFVMPALLVVIDFLFVYPSNKEDVPLNRRLLCWYLPVILIWFSYLGYREAVLGHAVVDKPNRDPVDNILVQSRVLITYIRLMFFPLHLNISYENMRLLNLADEFYKNPIIGGWVFPSMVTLAGLGALAVAFYKRQPMISFVIANFFITLSVTSLIPLNAVMNEHRLYLPSLGACMIMAGVVERTAGYMSLRKGAAHTSWPLPVQALTVAVLGLLAAITVNRNFSFHTDLTVWTDSIWKSPEKAQVVSDLGNAYYRGGRNLTSGGKFTRDGEISKEERAETYLDFHNYISYDVTRENGLDNKEELREEYIEYVPIGKITPEIGKNLRHLYVKGLNRAEMLYLWGIRVERNYYKAWHNLGTINYTYAHIELDKGETEEAKHHLEKAIRFFEGAANISENGESHNDGASARMRLAELTEDQERSKEILREAEYHYLKAIKLNPELYKAFVNLAIVKSKLGKEKEALPYIEQAIRINPVEPKLYYYRARFLLGQNELEKARQVLDKCLKLSPGYPLCKKAKDRMEKLMKGETPGVPAPSQR